MMRYTTITTLCWVTIALLLPSSVFCIDDYLTNESEDDGAAPKRVSIPSFQLQLSPTFGTLTGVEEKTLEEAADTILAAYIATKVNYTVDYVRLVNIVADEELYHTRRRRHLQEETTLVEIAGGLASFRGGEPTVDEVNAWTKEALEAPLVEYLQEETDLGYIETSVFTSLTPAPTPSPTIAVAAAVTQDTAVPSNQTGLIAGGVVAGFAVMTIVAVGLLVMKRRRQGNTSSPTKSKPVIVKQVPDTPETRDHLEDSLDVSQEDDSFATNQNYNRNNDVSFDVESTSEWTLSSNATDAYTIKSGQMFPRSSHSLMQTESFERDRQVSLKKDMMQTPWSTAVPPTLRQSSSSVLKSSYFTSSDGGGSYDMDDDWNPDDDATSSQAASESPFRFQAQGEEIVLMPPSQTRSSRNGV